MSRVRIYELAKEAGLKSKELADKPKGAAAGGFFPRRRRLYAVQGSKKER